MKIMCVRVLICFMILVFVGGFMGETVYANNHQDCSCCTANKCHANTKCHNTTKACTCSYQITQALLPKRNTSFELVLTGYLAHTLDFAYLYLSVEDIFHPPKAS